MMVQAREAVFKVDFEHASLLLKVINPRRVRHPAEYHYLRSVTEFSLNNRKVADASCDWLLDDFTLTVPNRYLALAYVMKKDMEQWKEKSLEAVGRKMDDVAKRLALGKAGPETRRRQKEILDGLDRMIKEAEDDAKPKETKGAEGGLPGEQEKGQGDAQGARPKDDSDIAGTSGKGEIDQKRIREIARVWGKLPEKEREKYLLDKSRDMPARYQDAIKKYLISISNRPGVTK
jgi:hypothetical protein